MERMVFANVGAEERDAPPNEAHDRLARAFTDVVQDAPWPWLRDARGLIAWLNDEGAANEARTRGLSLWGAPVEVVRTVHDKGFVVDAQDGFPCALIGPDDLTAAGVARAVAGWPAWARASFTLKPRWGTSGRGRARGVDGALAPDAIGALPRFARGGGAVIETWASRVLDLSSLWCIDDATRLELVGTTRQITRPSGVYLGCTFTVAADTDARVGQVRASTVWDARVVDGARAIVARAAALGYRGPLGVDAFVWRHPESGAETLRAVVEVNARFTAGHVAIALALARGERGRFTFALDRDPVMVRGE